MIQNFGQNGAAYTPVLTVLLFYRNIDFGTKYPREDENGEAKIRPFTRSQ